MSHGKRKMLRRIRFFILTVFLLFIAGLACINFFPIRKITLYSDVDGDVLDDDESCISNVILPTVDYFIAHSKKEQKNFLISASKFYAEFMLGLDSLPEITRVEVPSLDLSFLDALDGDITEKSVSTAEPKYADMQDSWLVIKYVIFIEHWSGKKEIVALGINDYIKIDTKYYAIEEGQNQKLFSLVKKYFPK